MPRAGTQLPFKNLEKLANKSHNKVLYIQRQCRTWIWFYLLGFSCIEWPAKKTQRPLPNNSRPLSAIPVSFVGKINEKSNGKNYKAKEVNDQKQVDPIMSRVSVVRSLDSTQTEVSVSHYFKFIHFHFPILFFYIMNNLMMSWKENVPKKQKEVTQRHSCFF